MTLSEFMSTRITGCQVKPSHTDRLYSFSLAGHLQGHVLNTLLASVQQKFSKAGVEVGEDRVYPVHKGRVDLDNGAEKADSKSLETIVKVRVSAKDVEKADAIAKRISKDAGVELTMCQRVYVKNRGILQITAPIHNGVRFG